MSREEAARLLAEEAHEGQYRKYVREPYVAHCKAVVDTMKGLPGTDEDDYAAAWLHDVLEDVAIPQDQVHHYAERIRAAAGDQVLDLVWQLTNPTHAPELKRLPRAERKRLDREHLAAVSKKAKRIKLADRLCNITDLAAQDAPPDFRRKYFQETELLLNVLADVDVALEAAIRRVIGEVK